MRCITMLAAGFLSVLAACGGGGGGSGTSGFGSSGVLEESGRMEESTRPDWWLNSGGRFEVGDGIGRTVQGELAPGDRWRQRYAGSNPRDTDGGAHPQNLFRLVRRSVLGNSRQTVRFNVTRTNLSSSGSRDQSNGVLLFERYQNGDNLYYAGVRVDGFAVVKKKSRGRYWTLGEAKVFPGSYDRRGNPNLIPLGRWIEIATETRTDGGGVTIRLFVDGNPTLEVRDEGRNGGVPIGPGLGGIRTDFMDVEFSGYSAAGAE